MAELTFTCLDVTPEHYAMSPTLLFRLRIEEASGAKVHSMALRCQIRVEPQRRDYGERETEQLLELFGERSRWGETRKPFQFANTSEMIAGFSGSTEIELAVPCSYDLEVAAGRYFHALEDGEIPFVLMFSGTVFGKGDHGLWIEQVPWHAETRHRTPVAVWQELMDIYFPNSGWLRLRRDTIDELARFKAARALPTWDDTLAALLEAATERTP
ncbi:MAG: DUF6084 family protein [Pseudonocardiaceae bacterium]